MNILYVGCMSPHYRTEVYVTHALRKLGHTVKTVEVRGCRERSLYQFADKINADFVLLSKSGHAWYNRFLERCRRRNLLTVTWLWDLYWGYRRPNLHHMRAEMLLTTDGGHDERWKEIDVKDHQVLRQGIHEPEAVMYEPNYKYDVGFVGTPTSHRVRSRMVRFLRDTYGLGDRYTEITDARGLQLNERLAEVKVIVGDSYPTDNYWSNRIYEIIGRGGFFMHPKTVGMKKEFKHGLHYVSFEACNHKQLKTDIDFWIKNNDLRENIKKTGFEHVKNNLTYEHRCKDLIERVQKHMQRKRLLEAVKLMAAE